MRRGHQSSVLGTKRRRRRGASTGLRLASSPVIACCSLSIYLPHRLLLPTHARAGPQIKEIPVAQKNIVQDPSVAELVAHRLVMGIVHVTHGKLRLCCACGSPTRLERSSHPRGRNIWKDFAVGCHVSFAVVFFSVSNL